MVWLKLEIEIGDLDAGHVEEALLTAGALSVTFQDAGDTPVYAADTVPAPLWKDTRVAALFPADTNMDAVCAVLLVALDLEHLPTHRVQSLEDREWSREWLKDFKPMRFGRRLWIVPSAYAPPEPAAVNLRLDPGLAFGSGTHPTTALCLEWLDGAALAGRAVLDYGCGSGVLAIAAALLGAARIWAVDNDPQALAATRENAARNQVSKIVEIRSVEAELATQVDVLIANILAAPLIELAPRFAALLRPGGELVLSGILDDQESELRAVYAPWFRFGGGAERDEWRRLDARRLSESR